MRTTLLTAGALLGALTAPALADVLLMKDGRIVEGPKMEQMEDHVVVHFENGDVKVMNDLVRTAIIEGGPDFVPQTDEEKEKFEKGLVPFKDKWVKPAKRDKLIEEELEKQREAIEANKEHSTWGNRYKEESKNFQWEFTIPKHVWERYEGSTEAYYTVFCKDWRIKRDKRKAKLKINFFANRDEFYRTSGAGGGTMAYFMFLGDYDLCAYYDRTDPDGTEMVLFHEVSHYLQKLVNEGFKFPHWPGEGLAEYYGGASWDGKKLEVGLVQEGRLTEVMSDISAGTFVGLEETIKVDAYTDYTWGWTLVHFLMENKEYKKDFQEYFVGLANARGVSRTDGPFNLRAVTPEESLRYFKECLDVEDEEDFLALQQEWYDYIQNDLKITSSAGLEKAAISATRQGKLIRGKRLFGEAHAAGGMTANGLHQYAGMLARDGERDKARSVWKEAIEKDPLVADFYWEMARIEQDETEQERLRALAKELDPEVDFWEIDF